jgi:hypothetical protein
MANGIISSLQIGGGDIGVFTTPYGVCSTAAETAAKTVKVNGDFVLATGARVLVNFSKGVAFMPSSTMSLNVNNTGAKYVRLDPTTNSGTDTTLSKYFTSDLGRVYEFVYNGSYWLLLTRDHDTDTNTITKLRTYKDDISEVNITNTAQTGEVVLGTAATKGVMNNTSTSSYVSASSTTVPTCATLYNFIQVTTETISTTIPANSMYTSVSITPATQNEIVMAVNKSSTSYYTTLTSNVALNNPYPDTVVFRRADDTDIT